MGTILAPARPAPPIPQKSSSTETPQVVTENHYHNIHPLYASLQRQTSKPMTGKYNLKQALSFRSVRETILNFTDSVLIE